MGKVRWEGLIVLGLVGAASAVLAAASDDPDILVTVARVDDRLVIDVTAPVPVAQREAWDVLTDFENMAAIVGNLESSRVLERADNRVVVEQKGARNEGPLRFAFETVREVELRPYSYMRSRLIRGTVERLEGTTTLAPHERGTLVSSHGDCVPGTWIPPLIGEIFLRNATREQYADLRREMIRRHARVTQP